MAQVLITEQHLQDIANAIRDKSGESTQYKPSEMAAAIEIISGGGSGLEYETGIFTPSADIARPTINFTNTHTKMPVFVLLSDVGEYLSTTYTNHSFLYVDHEKLIGPVYASTTNPQTAVAWYKYRNTSTSSLTQGQVIMSVSSDSTEDSANYCPRYWVTPQYFKPSSNATSRYWRAGRTYKWIAMWEFE